MPKDAILLSGSFLQPSRHRLEAAAASDTEREECCIGGMEEGEAREDLNI